MKKKHRFYYVTGSKGGVGKSLIANALAFWLMEQNKEVRVIDTDDSNPDVGTLYEQMMKVDYSPLTDDPISWSNFLDKLYEYSREVGDSTQLHVVVNGAARDNVSIERNGNMLNGIFQEEDFDYDFTAIWALSTSIDSVSLLARYMSTIHTGTVFVFRNLFFGEQRKFTTFNETFSDMKIDGIYNFPVLASDLANYIHVEKLPFSDVLSQLSPGRRQIYRFWLSSIRQVFGDMSNVINNLMEG